MSSSTAPQHVFPPHTPERGRPRTRYPSHLSHQLDDEGKPRTLLHRRGTSHMYETLEDLLKEAGYKETRIFTPEIERRDTERQRMRDISAVGGAVVKMFSTWMSKKSAVDLDDDTRPSCPPSPLAHRTRAPRSNIAPLHMQPSQSPSNSSLLTVRPPAHLKATAALQKQHLLTRQPLRPPVPQPPALGVSNPNSRARLALRHAASAPHMDKRRARTQPRTSRASKAQAAPLPSTWLESLSAALLSPRGTPPASPTASGSTRPPRKPTVLPNRTPTSVAVTITNVVCRSAPTSRSSSAVRPPSKNKARVAVPVPTLAQTCVCEEQVATAWPPHSPHRLPNDASAPLLIDDDEDDELNLTMMLIPSKRQHSIRSLRSVLQQQRSFPCSASAVYARDEFARVMRRRIEESECEDDVEGEGEGEGHWDSGEFLTAKVKRRRSNLPRQWSWAT